MYVLDKEKIEIDKQEVEDKINNEESKEVDGSLETKLDESGDDNENSENQCEPEFEIRLLENKLKEQEEAFLRVNAEYSNFRRRTSEEKASIGLFANEKIMNELIPVLDNMERALDAYEDKENQLFVGVDMVYKQLVDALQKSGLEEIQANIGDEFDHKYHMAVLQEESSDYEAGKILMVLQKGYKLGKKVIRASMVKVSC